MLNANDEYVSQFGRDFKGRVITYGTHATADLRAENIRSAAGRTVAEFDIVMGDAPRTCPPAAGR